MNTDTLEKQFKKIGADIAISSSGPNGRGLSDDAFSIDFRDEHYTITVGEDVKMEVVDIDSKDRHLLLNVSIPGRGRDKSTSIKHKILCGHDERDYFVAAVPGGSAKNVTEAKNALKPKMVKSIEEDIKSSKRNKRKLKNRVRQGEWFFVKTAGINPSPLLIHKNEPISRGMGSKSHMVDELYRTGGTAVRVCSQYPTGLTETEYQKLVRKDPSKADLSWRSMTRDAQAYARGCVRHPNHGTIVLDDWHLIVMNTENESSFRRNIAFLD